MSDHAALVTFYQGWSDSHVVSTDGFPTYADTVMVRIERPPLLHLERPATRDDFRDHPEEYAAFQAIEKAKRNTGTEGYPLVYWPAASMAEVKMLAVRNISTVEELAKLAGNRDLPGQLADLALRAERMLDMQKNFGKYEALLQERDGQLEVLNGQVSELKVSLSAANALIETMKINRAA
jgi:hypothetical protein